MLDYKIFKTQDLCILLLINIKHLWWNFKNLLLDPDKNLVKKTTWHKIGLGNRDQIFKFQMMIYRFSNAWIALSKTFNLGQLLSQRRIFLNFSIFVDNLSLCRFACCRRCSLACAKCFDVFEIDLNSLFCTACGCWWLDS